MEVWKRFKHQGQTVRQKLAIKKITLPTMASFQLMTRSSPCLSWLHSPQRSNQPFFKHIFYCCLYHSFFVSLLSPYQNQDLQPPFVVCRLLVFWRARGTRLIYTRTLVTSKCGQSALHSSWAQMALISQISGQSKKWLRYRVTGGKTSNGFRAQALDWRSGELHSADDNWMRIMEGKLELSGSVSTCICKKGTARKAS